MSQDVSEEALKEIVYAENPDKIREYEEKMKEYEENYQTAKKWFIVILIACVIIVLIMFLYVWKYKMPRG